MKKYDVFCYTSLSSGNQVDGLPLVIELQKQWYFTSEGVKLIGDFFDLKIRFVRKFNYELS